MLLDEKEKIGSAKARNNAIKGKVDYICKRESQANGEPAYGTDGYLIARPTCDEGLCCGSAQLQNGFKKNEDGSNSEVPELVGPIIESCQLETTITYVYQPETPSGGEKPKVITWNFKCIEYASTLAFA